jgi:hypothetical protein
MAHLFSHFLTFDVEFSASSPTRWGSRAIAITRTSCHERQVRALINYGLPSGSSEHRKCRRKLQTYLIVPSPSPHASRTSFETSHSASSLTLACSNSAAESCLARAAFCMKRRLKVPLLNALAAIIERFRKSFRKRWMGINKSKNYMTKRNARTMPEVRRRKGKEARSHDANVSRRDLRKNSDVGKNEDRVGELTCPLPRPKSSALLLPRFCCSSFRPRNSKIDFQK